MYDAVMAETIRISGDQDTEIGSYFARPLGPGPYPGVVVVHHMPGWDDWSKQVTRTFAVHGYSAVCPNLHYREGPDSTPEDASGAVRAAGGVPDQRCVGDVAGAARFLRSLTNSNDRVGVIGYCSGGRQAWLCACRVPFDAAVVCYGGSIVATPDQLSERKPVAPIDMTADLGCPLLGLFGADDTNPSPAHVARMEEALQAAGKTYQLHSYEGAGHAFFAVQRAAQYRAEAANEGWQRIWAWFGQYLGTGGGGGGGG